MRWALADVLPAVADLLGVREYAGRGEWLADSLGARPRRFVVLLVDGLGSAMLTKHATDAPALSGLAEAGPLAAPFPATTCVSLTSFGTGLPPGQHGIVGTTFRLEDGATLAPLSWGADPNPIATQPDSTVLERAAADGVLVASVGPAQHRMSGLTRAALRGGEYVAAETLPERVAGAAEVLARASGAGRAALVYIYWPEVDKAAHVHGPASDELREQLRRVDGLVSELVALTGPRTALLVTADHGHVDVPEERRFDLESRPALRVGVETILGEPRVRHVYAQPGRAEEVRRVWAQELGGRADVRTRAEVEELLGPVDEWYAERIGDVVAIARDNWALVSDRVDRIVSSLRGQHGGLTDDEVLVPLRVAVG